MCVNWFLKYAVLVKLEHFLKIYALLYCGTIQRTTPMASVLFFTCYSAIVCIALNQFNLILHLCLRGKILYLIAIKYVNCPLWAVKCIELLSDWQIRIENDQNVLWSFLKVMHRTITEWTLMSVRSPASYISRTTEQILIPRFSWSKLRAVGGFNFNLDVTLSSNLTRSWFWEYICRLTVYKIPFLSRCYLKLVLDTFVDMVHV